MAQRARPAPAGLDPDELDALQMLYTTGHDYFAEAAGHYGVEDEKALREIARARWPIRGASFFARHQETLPVIRTVRYRGQCDGGAFRKRKPAPADPRRGEADGREADRGALKPAYSATPTTS